MDINFFKSGDQFEITRVRQRSYILEVNLIWVNVVRYTTFFKKKVYKTFFNLWNVTMTTDWSSAIYLWIHRIFERLRCWRLGSSPNIVDFITEQITIYTRINKYNKYNKYTRVSFLKLHLLRLLYLLTIILYAHVRRIVHKPSGRLKPKSGSF